MEEKKVVRSRYSYLFRTTNGVYLAYVSKGNSFLECDEELYDFLVKFHPGEEIEDVCKKLPADVLNVLVSTGVLCDKFDDDDYLNKLRFINQASQHDMSSLGIIIVPTLDCNFSCPYCFEKNKRPIYMSKEVREKLVRFIIDKSQKRPITLYWYGGEPLLAKDCIEDILNNMIGNVEIKEHALITNGFFLTQTATRLFEDSFPLNEIQVTLDGCKERHNKLRALKNNNNISTYDIIMNNIEEFATSHPSCSIYVRVNIDKSNYIDYERIKAECSKFNQWDNIHVYPGMIRLENEEQTRSIEPAYGRWEIAELLYKELIESNKPERLFPKIRYTKNCAANRVNSYIIGPEGEIYKCWNDVSNPQMVVGNIDVDEITNPTIYYRYHSSCSCFNDPACLNCFYLPICNGKCSWYQMKNKYNKGEFNLCQCLLKAPGMIDKILEKYYDYAAKR